MQQQKLEIIPFKFKNLSHQGFTLFQSAPHNPRPKRGVPFDEQPIYFAYNEMALTEILDTKTTPIVVVTSRELSGIIGQEARDYAQKMENGVVELGTEKDFLKSKYKDLYAFILTVEKYPARQVYDPFRHLVSEYREAVKRLEELAITLTAAKRAKMADATKTAAEEIVKAKKPASSK